MSDSSVSDTHSGGTARTLSQHTSPSHGTLSSHSRQDSTTLFTALFDYEAHGEDELSLQRGETVEVNKYRRFSGFSINGRDYKFIFSSSNILVKGFVKRFKNIW